MTFLVPITRSTRTDRFVYELLMAKIPRRTCTICAEAVSGIGGRYLLPSFGYPRVKLLYISVLWRASVSHHSMYKGVDLGPREPELRRHLLEADPDAKDDFGVVLQAFDETNVGMLNPGMKRFDGLRFCSIYLAHVIAFIKTDRRPFQHPFDVMAFQPDAPLVIIRKDFARSPKRRLLSRLVLDENQKREARRRAL